MLLQTRRHLQPSDSPAIPDSHRKQRNEPTDRPHVHPQNWEKNLFVLVEVELQFFQSLVDFSAAIGRHGTILGWLLVAGGRLVS
jgi:hypothetical protein